MRSSSSSFFCSNWMGHRSRFGRRDGRGSCGAVVEGDQEERRDGMLPAGRDGEKRERKEEDKKAKCQARREVALMGPGWWESKGEVEVERLAETGWLGGEKGRERGRDDAG